MSHCPHSWYNGLGGAIAYDSRSTLIVMRGTLTGIRYIDDIIRPHVGLFLNGLPGQFSIKITLVRIQQELLKTSCVIFRLFPWPTRSPDLSPVVHVWGSSKTADAIVSLYMI
ncbi:transposable element Tcb1 transposase [Trichonephila clavipes]|nr:transposable element Tcb1 transposase [Trichonephila clavipes]